MAVISYAQNFEDVMLWRALKHIEKGFYIDIGAWLPDIDSVTKAFYDSGWSGINIEPDFDAFSRLVKERPRDINLQLAVSDKHGEADLQIIKGTGLTTLRENIAEKHLKTDHLKTTTRIQVRTLNEICNEYVPSHQDIHFLKVDVEGMEEAVLRGNDWSRYRPWIIVIEATLPNSQQETYEVWEHILLSACYNFAYADGLNRFYVADEHSELLPAFKYPPNVFDDFKLNAQHIAEERAEKLDMRNHQLITELTGERERSRCLEHELQSAYTSYCWRITAPMRSGFDLFLRTKATFYEGSRLLKLSIASMAGLILTAMIRTVLYQPFFESFARNILHNFPVLEQKLYKFAVAKSLLGHRVGHSLYELPTNPAGLTPDARYVYEELKASIERQRRDG